MNPLKRNNPGVRATDHEDRIQVLERRVIPQGLPWAFCTNSANAQVITTDTELTFDTGATGTRTNDDEVFRFDPADPEGLLIYQEGLYGFFAAVRYAGGSSGVSRSMYQTLVPLSSGTVFGSELGEQAFSVGSGQNQASLGEVSSIAKTVLNHIAIVAITAPPAADPWRLSVTLIHNGVDYTLNGGLASTVTVVQFDDEGFDTAHEILPPE